MSHNRILPTLKKVEPPGRRSLLWPDPEGAEIRNKAVDAMIKGNSDQVAKLRLESCKAESVTRFDSGFFGGVTISMLVAGVFLYNEFLEFISIRQKSPPTQDDIRILNNIVVLGVLIISAAPFITTVASLNNLRRNQETTAGCDAWLKNKAEAGLAMRNQKHMPSFISTATPAAQKHEATEGELSKPTQHFPEAIKTPGLSACRLG